MERNYELFPGDQDGDALWECHLDGWDLSSSYRVSFGASFKDEDSAANFAKYLGERGIEAIRYIQDGSPEDYWAVQVTTTLVPTYENMKSYLSAYIRQAQEFGGGDDGWQIWPNKSA